MKGNPILGSSSGRLGNLSMYVIKGQQLTRATNHHPKNPRTRTQMAQRVQFSNLVSTYRILSRLMKGAYQAKEKTHSSFNTFMKCNLGIVKVYLTKSEAAAKACIVAPYNITQGTLSSIEWNRQGNTLVSSICLPEGFTLTSTTTIGEVSAALLSANRAMMQKGDLLSIIHMVQSISTNSEMPRAALKLHKFNLDPGADDLFYDLIPQPLFYGNSGYVGTDANAETGGIAYVLSRTIANKINVSSQSIVLTTGNTLFQKYSSDEKKVQAIESYGVTELAFLDSRAPLTPQDDEDAYFSVTMVTKNGTAIPKGSEALEVVAGDVIQLTGTKLTEVELKARYRTDPTGSEVTTDLSVIGTVNVVSDQSVTINVTISLALIDYLLRADNAVIIYNFI